MVLIHEVDSIVPLKDRKDAQQLPRGLSGHTQSSVLCFPLVFWPSAVLSWGDYQELLTNLHSTKDSRPRMGRQLPGEPSLSPAYPTGQDHRVETMANTY